MHGAVVDTREVERGAPRVILVDATVVSLVLVPAVMQLLGRGNWWIPGWLDRLLPGRHAAEPRHVAARLTGAETQG